MFEEGCHSVLKEPDSEDGLEAEALDVPPLAQASANAPVLAQPTAEAPDQSGPTPAPEGAPEPIIP